MKIGFLLVLCAVTSASAFAGTTFTCVGPSLLLVETVGDSGIAIPGRSGVLYFQDQLVERHVGNYGDLEVKWQNVAVAKKNLATLAATKKGNVTVTATLEELTVTGIQGQDAIVESATCSNVSEFKPVP